MADVSHVGAVIDEVNFPVEEGKVREFALAVGAGDTCAVPLTFSTVAGHWRDQGAMVRMLQAAMMAAAVSQWLGGPERVASYGVRFRDKVWPGDRLVLHGEISAGPDGTRRCERPPGPPKVQRARMAVANGLLPHRRCVDRI